MIFKLWFVITKAQLFMHYDYFEWAPCIETFGFFSKCENHTNLESREFKLPESVEKPVKGGECSEL